MMAHPKISRLTQVALSLIPLRTHIIPSSFNFRVASGSLIPQLGRMQFSGRAMSPQISYGVEPHLYTNGRWLRDDSRERHLRRIDFDFDKLCQKVLDVSEGAKSIEKCEKKEGGFNRVFIFTMDDGSRAVARLPFMIAGPAKFITASEVATIKFLQKNTGVPIPKILDWSDDATNCVGSEYIIMEHVTGVQLHQKWPHMSGDEKVKCIDAIYRKLKDVANLDFPAYGSLYFSTSGSGSSFTLPLQDDFCIGPHCGTRYWNCGDCRYYRHCAPNHGPWLTINDFVNSLVDAGLSRIPPTESQSSNRPSYHGSIQTHLGLLERGRAVLNAMSIDRRVYNAAAPTLFHPDLHKRNIFVSEDDPSTITGIIDWQSSSVEPAFWYADEVPDFATCPSSSGSPAQREDESDLCAEVYEVCTQFLTPRLAHPRSMNEGLFRPFRYCYRTWKDGAPAFRHELIQTLKYWQTLGFSGSCPLSMPIPEDTDLHQKEYKHFEAAQNLKHDLSNLLDTASDGWVPTEDWEAAKAGNRAMFSGMLQAVLENKDPDEDEPIRNEGDLREIWPFDLPEES